MPDNVLKERAEAGTITGGQVWVTTGLSYDLHTISVIVRTGQRLHDRLRH